MPAFVSASNSGDALIRVHVKPGARVTSLERSDDGGSLEVKLAAEAKEGAANEELIATLAKLLRVGKTTIALVSGATSRDKVVCVTGKSPAEVAGALLAATAS